MERIERINAMIKREISVMIQGEIKDPRLAFVTITTVKVSKDLSHARVNFSVLGTEDQVKQAQAGLDSARGYIRRLIGQRVRIRHIPEVEFFHDKSIEYSARIEEALNEIHKLEKMNHDGQ